MRWPQHSAKQTLAVNAFDAAKVRKADVGALVVDPDQANVEIRRCERKADVGIHPSKGLL